jgi:hypothetical protein
MPRTHFKMSSKMGADHGDGDLTEILSELDAVLA